jgi:hypothetical protein
MIGVHRLLFPSRPRTWRGERWVNIALRCVHLVGVAGIGGGFLFDLEPARWTAFWHLTLASGGLLCLLYLWSTGLWLFQVKGLAVVVKLALLAIAVAVPAWRGEIFTLVIVLSGLVAHAPAEVRAARPLPLGGTGQPPRSGD